MFTHQLAQIAKSQLLAPKWLLAPSLRVGQQWLETVIRTGQPIVNFRVFTVRALAMELAAPKIAESDFFLLDPAAGAMLVGHLLDAARSTYLGDLERTPTLEKALYDSLNTIRLAGLKPDQIQPPKFEVSQKGVELTELLAQFEHELRSRRLVDYADALVLAITRLRADPNGLPAETVVLVPPDLDLNRLERDFIESLPERQRCHLADEKRSPDDSDLAFFADVLGTGNLPAAHQDRTLDLFRAVGTVNEVREVLRRCINEQRPLDEVELLHTDTETYIPLIYELAQRFVGDDGMPDGIPVTLAEGIPAAYGRPGRALSAWLAWSSQDYPQQHLVRMIQDGLLELKSDEHSLSFSGLAAMLRPIGIGWGRDRYLSKINEQIRAVRAQVDSIAKSTEVVSEAGASTAGADVELQAAERRLIGLELLRQCVARLLELSDSPAENPVILENAIRFLQSAARSVTELDHYVKERLVEEIQRLRNAIELCGGGFSGSLREWLEDLPKRTSILGSGPRSGCLHVAHLLSGGHSGRTRTFVVGLDDTRFPGVPCQDPVLLDGERRRLSPDLPLAGAKPEQAYQAFGRLVAQLRGTLSLSYSCLDLVDDRELFPSPILLTAFRFLTGDAEADQRKLDTLPTASFAAELPEKALDEGEWWLWRFSGDDRIQDARDQVGKRFPHLGRGFVAAVNRSSRQLTPFDGHVTEAGTNFDPAKAPQPLSATALETIGQCPLRYFFRYPLRVQLPEEMVLDVERWLDPLAFGSLLHDVFRRFMQELKVAGRRPVFEADELRLAELLRENIEAFRREIPPPNEPAFRKQCRQLRRAARIFLVAETDFCRTSSPQYFEVSVGIAAEGEGSELDTVEPVVVTLPGGGFLRACGRIDRIDCVTPDQFAIWDYKTGSSWRYKNNDPFQQGRLIQNALYLSMAESVLREKVSKSAAIARFGYFFPGEREWGHRISWSKEELVPGLQIVEQLCRIISAGAFVATDREEDCHFCDYQLVCSDVRSVTSAARDKLDNAANETLDAMRTLRR